MKKTATFISASLATAMLIGSSFAQAPQQTPTPTLPREGAPADVPGVLEFLSAQGGKIIAAAAQFGEGPACAALLRKIKECATYALKHSLGYLEASGILPEVETPVAAEAR